MNHISLKQIGLDVIQKSPTAQDPVLRWPGNGDCSQVAGLIQKVG